MLENHVFEITATSYEGQCVTFYQHLDVDTNKRIKTKYIFISCIISHHAFAYCVYIRHAKATHHTTWAYPLSHKSSYLQISMSQVSRL